MKSIISIIVLIVLILLFLYFYQGKDSENKHPKNRPVNQVSLADNSDSTSIDTVKTSNIKTNKPVLDTISNAIIKDKNEKQEESDLDYITAFRDWQYFDNCYTDIEDFHNDTNPLDTLAARFANNPRESQTQPTAQQNMYYQHHVDICKALIDDEEGDYFQVKSILKDRFERINPKTDEEKQLQHALDMVKQLQNYKLRFTKIHRNKSTMPPQELAALEEQIVQLTADMMAVYNSSDSLSPEQTAQFEQYSQQIESIRLKIEGSKKYDLKEVRKAQKQINGFLNSMDDYLHRVKSADAFLLLSAKLYNVDIFQKSSTVIESMKDATGIYDSYYINILNNIVMPLVSCSMDYPCDDESDYILSYCLGLKGSMFNQACGRSLEDFYFSFYIGENQLNDVNVYFNYLVNRYAN